MQYQEYLQSDRWKKLRAKKFKKHRACSICGSKESLDVHHLSYKNLYDVLPSDLRVMCRKCHCLVHYLFKKGLIKFGSEKANKRFRAIKKGFARYFKLGKKKLNSKLVGIWDKQEFKGEYKFK